MALNSVLSAALTVIIIYS